VIKSQSKCKQNIRKTSLTSIYIYVSINKQRKCLSADGIIFSRQLLPSIFSRNELNHQRLSFLNKKVREVLATTSTHLSYTLFLFHSALLINTRHNQSTSSYHFPHTEVVIMAPTRFDILFDKDGNPDTPHEFEEIVSQTSIPTLPQYANPITTAV